MMVRMVGVGRRKSGLERAHKEFSSLPLRAAHNHLVNLLPENPMPGHKAGMWYTHSYVQALTHSHKVKCKIFRRRAGSLHLRQNKSNYTPHHSTHVKGTVLHHSINNKRTNLWGDKNVHPTANHNVSQ